MKSICLSIAFLCTALLAAQEQDYPQSISAYVNLWPLYSSQGNSTSIQAPGIRQAFKQTPYLMGIDITQRLNKRWHYFLSAQGSFHYITSQTTIELPQPLPPFTAATESQLSDLEAFQVMVGGGAQYRILEKRWTFIRFSAGLFGAYTHDRNETAQGIELLKVDSPSNTLVWEAGGTVEHSVTRRFVPVGRLGMGAQYIFQRVPRFCIGADLFYYVAPKFIEGSWSRDLPGTNNLATQGNYQAGLNNLMIAAQIAYRF
jgi:hypothetical protein